MEHEIIIDIPATFKRKYGFSFDCGSSLQKVVCATPHGESTRLHFISFKDKIMDDALKYIEEKCGDHIEEGSTIYVTGFNADQNKTLIQEKFGISIKAGHEFVCYVEGFLFLSKHLASADLVFPKSAEAESYGKEFSDNFTHMISSLQPMNKDVWTKTFHFGQKVEDGKSKQDRLDDQGHMELEYPLMVVLSGSAFMYYIVDADGTFGHVNVINPIAGRTLMGLSSLMLGTKTFDEFEQLASQGCSTPLHSITGQGQMSVGSGEAYENIDRILAFMFGDAVGKNASDFRKEDIARGLMSMVAWQAAYSTLLACGTYNVRQVFFCGGLTSGSETFREELNKYMEELRIYSPEGVMPFYIVKLGGYTAALSALITNLQSE